MLGALALWLALAQDPAPPSDLDVGWHDVQPGETLEGITAHYLGTSERWRENWHLNPSLQNPHMITPGTRLRIIMSAAALLMQNPDPSEADVRAALDRNLCRCGSHNRMVRAILAAAQETAQKTAQQTAQRTVSP